jgi:hypothetical protein
MKLHAGQPMKSLVLSADGSLTAIKNCASSVPAAVMQSLGRRRIAMDKSFAKRLFNYKTTMSIVKKMLADGIITEGEYSKIDTIIANKYGFNSCSIYREIA